MFDKKNYIKKVPLLFQMIGELVFLVHWNIYLFGLSLAKINIQTITITQNFIF